MLIILLSSASAGSCHSWLSNTVATTVAVNLKIKDGENQRYLKASGTV